MPQVLSSGTAVVMVQASPTQPIDAPEINTDSASVPLTSALERQTKSRPKAALPFFGCR